MFIFFVLFFSLHFPFSFLGHIAILLRRTGYPSDVVRWVICSSGCCMGYSQPNVSTIYTYPSPAKNLNLYTRYMKHLKLAPFPSPILRVLGGYNIIPPFLCGYPNAFCNDWLPLPPLENPLIHWPSNDPVDEMEDELALWGVLKIHLTLIEGNGKGREGDVLNKIQ